MSPLAEPSADPTPKAGDTWLRPRPSSPRELPSSDARAIRAGAVGFTFQAPTVTRECIRQIEAKALRKLRHPSRSKKLKDYLE